MGDLCIVWGAEGTCSEDKLDREQSLIFLCKVTARERRGRLSRETRASRLNPYIITSWFAIALDEIRTGRILREKADCKQSKDKSRTQTNICTYFIPPSIPLFVQLVKHARWLVNHSH